MDYKGVVAHCGTKIHFSLRLTLEACSTLVAPVEPSPILLLSNLVLLLSFFLYTLTVCFVGENFLQFSQNACILFSQPNDPFRIVPKFINSGVSFVVLAGYVRLQVKSMLCFDFSSLHLRQRLMLICLVPKRRLISVSSLILLRSRSSSRLFSSKGNRDLLKVYSLFYSQLTLPCLTSIA
ncbi:hypothetical protein FF38_09850 [Lucilia cuprina]|uniref:Uncharacterized protein n=1 Tax=Lucilia cuprina TaxID=7375 RepID=A0A0L0CMC1_LUCCU|nr:hypothetical protein FF38_09850 [Lucilia cuprina]